MLGAGEVDSFKDHAFASLCYNLFIAATIITHITFLNMLIAIMGDTFDRVIDQRPTYSLKNQIMILAAYRSLIQTRQSKTKQDDPEVFIYVIQPSISGDGEEGTGNDNAWRGKLHYLQHLIKTKLTKNNKQMQQSITDIQKQNLLI